VQSGGEEMAWRYTRFKSTAYRWDNQERPRVRQKYESAVTLVRKYGRYPLRLGEYIPAGVDGMLPLQLTSGSANSHPNAAATTSVAPQLVKQVFDTTLAYEAVTGVVGPGTTIPGTLQLEKNYPNPFNPSTTIRYGLPNRSHVTLAVFNTLGQQVALLENGEQEAGYHEVKFDGNGLGTGVYFY
jgi:hypothetical protein